MRCGGAAQALRSDACAEPSGAPGHRECATYRLRALHVRKVTWRLPLELGEVARDHRHIAASENRLLWLASEQETEGCLKTALGRMFAGHQPLAHFTGHGDASRPLLHERPLRN